MTTAGTQSGEVARLPAGRRAVLYAVRRRGEATADQVAAAITFLLSDDAANINGAILPCDGGWSAI